jgi:hypothetical protein
MTALAPYLIAVGLIFYADLGAARLAGAAFGVAAMRASRFASGDLRAAGLPLACCGQPDKRRRVASGTPSLWSTPGQGADGTKRYQTELLRQPEDRLTSKDAG